MTLRQHHLQLLIFRIRIANELFSNFLLYGSMDIVLKPSQSGFILLSLLAHLSPLCTWPPTPG